MQDIYGDIMQISKFDFHILIENRIPYDIETVDLFSSRLRFASESYRYWIINLAWNLRPIAVRTVYETGAKQIDRETLKGWCLESAAHNIPVHIYNLLNDWFFVRKQGDRFHTRDKRGRFGLVRDTRMLKRWFDRMLLRQQHQTQTTQMAMGWLLRGKIIIIIMISHSFASRLIIVLPAGKFCWYDFQMIFLITPL